MSAVVLTAAQRSALRGLAHGLAVTVHVGQGGITPAVLKEIDIALNVHGLLKVRVLIAGRDEREQMLAQLADGLFCAPVQHIGRILVLWRARPEDAVPLQLARANPHPSRGPEPKAAPGSRRSAATAARGQGSRRPPSGDDRRGGAAEPPRGGRRPAAAPAQRRQPDRGPRPSDRDGFVAERGAEERPAARRPRAGAGPARSVERHEAPARPAGRRSSPSAERFGERPDAVRSRPAGGARPATGGARSGPPGARSGPGSGARSGTSAGARSGPGAGARSSPGSGPRSSPGSGSRSGPGSGPRSGPGAGPRSGPGAGPRSGPGGGRPRTRKPGRD